ncbi:hypothetical protein [Haloferula sp. A504]|uniref:hypothetical protein n=1 Tax=Haloferula sp. A504 TaxID=3373601 RepID=UPI0031CAD748|nr:hypothetical protein [Verrucomicrobiaceae bacterium E54]
MLLLLGAGLSAGCGDDPALMRKKEEQKAEIRNLEGELVLLRERTDRAPKDRSSELKEVRAEIVREEAEIGRLEVELSNSAIEHRKIEEEFDRYKRDYPIR